MIEAQRVRRAVRPRARPRPRPRRPRGAAAPTESPDTLAAGQRRHGRAGHLPPRPLRDPDRGRRRRHRGRPREPGAVHEGARDRRLATCRAVADTGRHQPVQERDAHRARRRGLADRRVPAREAGQGRRVRPTKLKSLDTGAVVDRTFRAGEKFPRVHTETKNVQYLYDDGSDVALHGRGDVRAVLAAARRARRRAPVHAAERDGADPRRGGKPRASSCPRRSS